jgi:predicted permease
MSWLSGFRQRLYETFLPGRASRDLREELRVHFEHELARQLREGTRPEDAHRAAAARVGNLQATHEAVRDGRAGRLVEDALRDVRLAARTVRRNPGFTAAVVVSLALGVGGTTAVFSLVNAVMVRPLPYVDPDRLAMVRIWWNDFSARLSSVDVATLEEAAAGVADVGAFFMPDDGFAMATPEGPELIDGAVITPRLLRVLGVSPLVGPGFSAQPNAPEALIGESLWVTRFRGSPTAIGQTIVLDGDSYVVVGVMPSGFNVPGQRRGAAWLKALSRQPTRRGPYYLIAVARIADGLAFETAATRLTSLVAPLLRDRYGAEPAWRYGLRPLQAALVGDVRGSLLLLLGGMVLVLAVAIVNVTNLMLARGSVQSREIAVRASLGAGRARLVRQLLAESALLGALGGVLGIALAWAFLTAAEAGISRAVPTLDGLPIDRTMTVFALVCGVGAAVLAGLFPAIRVPWCHLPRLLRDGGRGVSGDRVQAGLRQALVVAELALTVVVLTGAVLLGRSVWKLESVDPGFDPVGRGSFRLTLPDDPYSDPATRASFLERLEQGLRAHPGVQDVAFAMALPPNLLQMSNNYTLQGRVGGGPRGNGVAEWNVVSPAYFSTLGIRLVEGRWFSEGDRATAPRVAIVNESFAQRHYPDGGAIGSHLKSGEWDPNAPWTTIVGIAADVPYGKGLWGGADATVYVPQAQTPWLQSFYVVMEAGPQPAQAVQGVQQVVRSLDARLPLRDPATMEQRLRDSTIEPRLRSLVYALIGGLALALAMTGVYGVMAYQVNLRRHEMAIRRALGATARDVVAGVLTSGVRLIVAGLIVGTAGALAFARTLAAVLFQVAPGDPGSYAAVALVLSGAALLACGIPALRTAAIEPAAVLRDDG